MNTNIPVMEPDRQYYYMDKCKELVLDFKKNKEVITYSVVTFGCQMNAHDSDKLKGILETIGFEEVDGEDADFVIFNTCTVRENANKKLYGHLGHLKSLKKKKPHMMIALCGCMMQEPHVVDTIKDKYKIVDIVFGTHNIYKLAELIYNRISNGERIFEILDKSYDTVEKLPQKRKYSFKSGVNIMYGCNNFCSYCIVPYVRGREKSRPAEDILAEIRDIVSKGVKEVMLLGQNVNSYGMIYDYEDGKIVRLPEEEKITFPELLTMVCGIEGLERIRFMTSHPKDLSDDLIAVMAREPKVCKHIHLPVQSGSTDILAKMNRRYTKEQYLNLVERIRKAMPDVSITTDIIVGFPGETEEDFLETLDVVEKVEYDQAYTFIYSKRTGTPASTMDNQIPEDVVKDRFNRLLKTVNEISYKRVGRYENVTKDVLVEVINHQDKNLVTGRTEENITVHFEGESSLIGHIVPVKLLSCKGFYYLGERES
ncbi:MAG: tRNA (N6-isopentenyl adenosine(37)-C2)-methylthiotransferase MiaB [Lachnospiraceae bacterium]|nr:tRNA (N6-isopentenyl adenosine(37)-C2)-methylthiotransferase MiaB [Lachnospiraceae bacterium]